MNAFFFGFALGFLLAVIVFDVISRCLVSDSEIEAWERYLKRVREEAGEKERK